MENSGKKFFECPAGFWDEINDVGLRNFYVCCCYAARLMVKRKKGLILNISSGVGLRSGFGPLPVPYEAGKAAIDRMSKETLFAIFTSAKKALKILFKKAKKIYFKENCI